MPKVRRLSRQAIDSPLASLIFPHNSAIASQLYQPPKGVHALKKRLLAWLLIFLSHRDELTIARSFNCGWRAANDISPAGTAEPIRINPTNCLGQNQPQPSRWDEFRWRAPNPQLKLRAIVQSAAGARYPQRFFLYQPPKGVHAPKPRTNTAGPPVAVMPNRGSAWCSPPSWSFPLCLFKIGSSVTLVQSSIVPCPQHRGILPPCARTAGL
jgi:hypothetical protein